MGAGGLLCVLEACPSVALTGQQEMAAALVVADQLTDAQIIAEVGIKSTDTLYRWKRLPAFQERVAEHQAAFAETVRASGLAVLENRVAALNHRWLLMKRVIAERAEDPGALSEPGGKTGLITVVTVTKAGTPIYGVDTALLKELRAHEQQAAQTLGQWLEKKEITGTQRLEITGIEVEE
jgi:hypothetical protein